MALLVFLQGEVAELSSSELCRITADRGLGTGLDVVQGNSVHAAHSDTRGCLCPTISRLTGEFSAIMHVRVEDRGGDC